MSFSDLCWTDLQISNLKPVIIKILVLQGLKTWQFITFVLRKCSWHIKHSQYRTAISSCTHPKRGRSQDLCFQGMLKTLSLPSVLQQNQGLPWKEGQVLLHPVLGWCCPELHRDWVTHQSSNLGCLWLKDFYPHIHLNHLPFFLLPRLGYSLLSL